MELVRRSFLRITTALLIGLSGFAAPPQPTRVTVKNFGFQPKEINVPTGTEVEWVNEGGRHSVQADDGSFKSPLLDVGASYKHKFDKPGRYMYFCEIHGSKGGHDMAGSVVVTAK